MFKLSYRLDLDNLSLNYNQIIYPILESNLKYLIKREIKLYFLLFLFPVIFKISNLPSHQHSIRIKKANSITNYNQIYKKINLVVNNIIHLLLTSQNHHLKFRYLKLFANFKYFLD
jgi:hypothetical protein